MLSCNDGLLNKVDLDDYTVDVDSQVCGYEELKIVSPTSPSLPEIPIIQKYNGNSKCVQLPELIDGKVNLSEGCYIGCIEVEGVVSIVGKGSEKTIIKCEDDLVPGAFYGKDVTLKISGISINSKTRGISLEGKSSLKIDTSAIYDCVQGGVKGCVENENCNLDIGLDNCLISDIKKGPDNSISYGVTIGPGTLNINSSVLKNFSSFAVAVWGDSRLNIENTTIENIFGTDGELYGVGIYAENSDVNMDRVKISNPATSFIYVANEGDQVNATFNDIELVGGENTDYQQGSLMLEGNIDAVLNRVSVNQSGGSGLFGNKVDLKASDIEIVEIDSDPNTENGFGIVLFDTKADLKRVEIKEAEKVGLLVDGTSDVFVQDFKISETLADRVIGEFGLGAAVQNGAVLRLEKGLVKDNRECGLMAVEAKLDLNNVQVIDTLPRKCSEDGSCSFAPGVPFGHGISLYSGSELSFSDLLIKNNSNGMNVENSTVQKVDAGIAFFIENGCAVNAWNIEDQLVFEAAFEDVTYCNNKSIYTTDVQPIRTGF